MLICTRGKGASLVKDRGIPGFIIAPRQEHSAKPDEKYRIAERMIPEGNRLELFARKRVLGFDAWGDELDWGSLAWKMHNRQNLTTAGLTVMSVLACLARAINVGKNVRLNVNENDDDG